MLPTSGIKSAAEFGRRTLTTSERSFTSRSVKDARISDAKPLPIRSKTPTGIVSGFVRGSDVMPIPAGMSKSAAKHAARRLAKGTQRRKGL